MKRLQILFVALWVTGSLWAQNPIITRQHDGDKTIITKVFPTRVDKHELRLGVGPLSFSTSVMMGSYGMPIYGPTENKPFRDQINDADTYLTTARFIGTYTLNYAYHSRRWFQAGATVGMSPFIQSRRDSATNKKVKNENEYLFFVMPTLRFVYLYREKVQLYSALSLGLTYATDDGFNAWGDIALVGCSFGDKVFGFAELGLGLGGNARIGIGVRLESKKK